MRTTLACLLLVGASLGCSEEAAPVEEGARVEDEGPCPPNVAVGGPCVRRTFCFEPPDIAEGTPVHERYAECPLDVPVPATESSNVGERAHLMAGDTCEQRRTGRDVCCYEYLTFCAR